ncbi:AcrR family transcriptional regulator [Sulfitobacter undariae]|uniref:AcrR family transcriptional regulator n=1 Tax=Sulfitobacter undariae TaxID=1563671 RepID=A0A7W6H126_9RHOB|nr:TetR/AcrR family transcriptional regulator [Sulfitobacter undariae]MBB3995165.1 AcrR family transcriptional regulator [Sulfitobacter undariae]
MSDLGTLPEGKTDSVQQIIDAAAQCFMAKGPEKATIDDVASLLGSTKGRVYHHFRSKNAILIEVHNQAMQSLSNTINPLIARDIPADQKLLEMAVAHANVIMDTFPFQRSVRLSVDIYLLGSSTTEEREIMGKLIDARNQYENLFRDVIRTGIEEGTLNVPDVAMATRALLGALNGLGDWYRIRPDQSQEEREAIAQNLADTVIHGIKA